MSVRPIVASGIVQRSQDVGQIKQNQDTKPMVDQHNIHHMNEKQAERASKQILKKESTADFKDNRHDAREKTKGVYFDNRKQKKKEEAEDDEDGIVIPKENHHFDMRI